jgi:hypothetical protein
MRESLDRYITGNYGEDQFERFDGCEWCGKVHRKGSQIEMKHSELLRKAHAKEAEYYRRKGIGIKQLKGRRELKDALGIK